MGANLTKPETKICELCKLPFTRRPRQNIDHFPRRRFCSASCSKEFHATKPKTCGNRLIGRVRGFVLRDVPRFNDDGTFSLNTASFYTQYRARPSKWTEQVKLRTIEEAKAWVEEQEKKADREDEVV